VKKQQWLFLVIILIITQGLCASDSPVSLEEARAIKKILGIDKFPFDPSLATMKVAVWDNGFGKKSELKEYLPNAELIDFSGKEYKNNKALDESEIHGRTMGMIIDRLVKVDLKLVNANGTTNLRLAKEWSIKNGVKIILYSQNWEYNGNFDGRGFLNSIVNEVTNTGIIFTVAAGNYGGRVYNGKVVKGDDNWLKLKGDQKCLRIKSNLDRNPLRMVLAWNSFTDQEEGGTDKDLDLYLLDETGAVRASSKLRQTLAKKELGKGESFLAREIIEYEADTIAEKTSTASNLYNYEGEPDADPAEVLPPPPIPGPGKAVPPNGIERALKKIDGPEIAPLPAPMVAAGPQAIPYKRGMVPPATVATPLGKSDMATDPFAPPILSEGSAQLPPPKLELPAPTLEQPAPRNIVDNASTIQRVVKTKRVLLNRNSKNGYYWACVKDHSNNWDSRDRIRLTVLERRPEVKVRRDRQFQDVKSIEFVDATTGREIMVPGDNATVITVGDPSSYSAIGPTMANVEKPEIFLPSSVADFSDGEGSLGTSNDAAYFVPVIATLLANRSDLNREMIVKWAKRTLNADKITSLTLAEIAPKLPPKVIEMVTVNSGERPVLAGQYADGRYVLGIKQNPSELRGLFPMPDDDKSDIDYRYFIQPVFVGPVTFDAFGIPHGDIEFHGRRFRKPDTGNRTMILPKGLIEIRKAMDIRMWQTPTPEQLKEMTL